jgi:hypothetical protein
MCNHTEQCFIFDHSAKLFPDRIARLGLHYKEENDVIYSEAPPRHRPRFPVARGARLVNLQQVNQDRPS